MKLGKSKPGNEFIRARRHYLSLVHRFNSCNCIQTVSFYAIKVAFGISFNCDISKIASFLIIVV